MKAIGRLSFNAMKHALTMLLALGLGGERASATDITENGQRGELAEHYLTQRQKNPGVFQGTPVSHVVPAFNTISYALAYQKEDVTVITEDNFNSAAELKLNGYSVSPYLSLSLKRIGLGFSVESGHKTASFESDADWERDRESQVDYRGVGAFVYWIPAGKVMKIVTPSLILGGRNYSAKQTSSEKNLAANTNNDVAINYSVPNYEAGLNVSIALLKSFSLIPWINYSKVDLKGAESQANSNSFASESLNTDISLFWEDRPDLRYGADFAVVMGPLQLRLGGLLGLIASSGSGSDRIEDKSVTLALSFEQKGN